MSEHEQVPWRDLQRAWQEPPRDQLPELRQLLRKRSFMIWALTGFDTVFSLAILVWLGWLVGRHQAPSMIAFAALLVGLLVAGWVSVLLIRRGTWRLDTAAPAAMLELSIRRCRASIKLATLNQYAIGLAFGLAFALRSTGFRAPGLGFEPSIWLRGAFFVFAAGWFLAAGWYRRRKRGELSRLRDLRDQI